MTDSADDGSRAARSTDRPALRRCLGIEPADFAATHWGQRPLLSPAGPRGGYDDLLDLAAVGELLSRRGLRTPFLRIAKGGDVVPPSRYTRSGGAGAAIADQVADDRVLDLLADDHTVVLQGLHRLWPPVIDFAAALADDVGHPVQVNAYLTPPGAQGFSAHYDTHDVFVLQIVGRKRWLVHAPVLDHPLADQPWQDRREQVAARAAEPPLMTAELGPGDALYLPRGFLHSAGALGGITLHLTVGIHPLTVHDVATTALTRLAGNADLRRSLPMRDPRDEAGGQLLPTVGAAINELAKAIESIDAREIAADVGVIGLRRTRPEPVDPVDQAGRLAALDASTHIRLRRHLRPVVAADGAGSSTLTMAHRTTSVGSLEIRLLRRLIDGEPLAAGTAAAAIDADPDDVVQAVRRLVRLGALVCVDAP